MYNLIYVHNENLITCRFINFNKYYKLIDAHVFIVLYIYEVFMYIIKTLFAALDLCESINT